MTNNTMMNICRFALTTLPGLDNETTAAVMTMRMSSAGQKQQAGAGCVDSVLNERAQASEDFAF